MHYFEIEGDVVQTHVTSPRSTAYLAALFHRNSRVHSFIAFGAGSKLNEYESLMSAIGSENIKIFAESFCDIHIDSSILEKVVGIFVTPPNSYSGVSDPIDLICSRGGDLTMLEVLTESEMSDNSRHRVAKILEEQKETLRLAMSRPQVQYCLYETHSLVDSENNEMVQYSIDTINQGAYTRHYKGCKDKRKMDTFIDVKQLEHFEKQMALTTHGKLKLKENKKFARKYDSETSSISSESDNEAIETYRSKRTRNSNMNSYNDDLISIKVSI